MYRHLRVRLKIGSLLLPSELRVNIGIKQGAITSPTIYNNATLRAQGDLSPCCILNGVSVSVLCYADDVLNLSRAVFSLEKSFREIAKNYNEIGLSLNAAKSQVLLFNFNRSETPDRVNLGDSDVVPLQELVYLGLPIGTSLKSTRKLLIARTERKIRNAYAGAVGSQLNLGKRHLAKVYNAVSLPHVLYLVPFWDIFNQSDKIEIRRAYFKYLKFLIRVPPWTRNGGLRER